MMTDVMKPPVEKTPPARPVMATEQEAREVAEAAREVEWSASFVRELFEGRFRLDLIHPFPEPTADPEPEPTPEQTPAVEPEPTAATGDGTEPGDTLPTGTAPAEPETQPGAVPLGPDTSDHER